LPRLLYALSKKFNLSLVKVFKHWVKWLEERKLKETFLRGNIQKKTIFFREFTSHLLGDILGEPVDGPPNLFEEELSLSSNEN